jgi:hypothetical protein
MHVFLLLFILTLFSMSSITTHQLEDVYEYVDLHYQKQLRRKGDQWQDDLQFDGKIIRWREIVSLSMFPAEIHLYPEGSKFIEKVICGTPQMYPAMYVEWERRQKSKSDLLK